MSSPSQPPSPPSLPEPRHRRDKKCSSAHHEHGHSMSPSTRHRLALPHRLARVINAVGHALVGVTAPLTAPGVPTLISCSCAMPRAHVICATRTVSTSRSHHFGAARTSLMHAWIWQTAWPVLWGIAPSPLPSPWVQGPLPILARLLLTRLLGGGFGALCPKEYQRLIRVTDLIPHTLQSQGNFPSQLLLQLPMSQYISKATSTWMSNPNSLLSLRGLPLSRRPSTMLRDVCSKALLGRNDPAKRLSSDRQMMTTGKYKPYSFSTSIFYTHSSMERHNTSSGTLMLGFPYPFLL